MTAKRAPITPPIPPTKPAAPADETDDDEAGAEEATLAALAVTLAAEVIVMAPDVDVASVDVASVDIASVDIAVVVAVTEAAEGRTDTPAAAAQEQRARAAVSTARPVAGPQPVTMQL